MKRCPECRRDYYDDTLLYCLDDGTRLLEGPATAPASDEPATVILSEPPASAGGTAPSESPTRPQILTTDQTAILPADISLPWSKRKLSSGKLTALIVAGIVLASVIGGGYLYLRHRNQSAGPSAPDNLKIQRLTGNGKVSRAAISPDGKFLAYVQSDGGQQSLWVKQIATNSNVQVIAPEVIEGYFGAIFTPDGSYIYFSGVSKDNPTATMYRVPTLGGSVSKIISNAWDSSVSPDGKQIVFERWDNDTTETSVLTVNADGTGERKIGSLTGHRYLTGAFSWSPDGKLIACGIGDDEKTVHFQTIAIMNVADGEFHELTDYKWDDINSVVWLPDMSGIIFSADDTGGGEGISKLWEISYPAGESRRLTQDLTDYSKITLTADGKTLVAVESENTSSLWVSPNADLNRAIQITTGKDRISRGIAWTPDKRIVYVSVASGNTEVWVMNSDGTNPKQLTNDARIKYTPVVSPDGRYVVYATSQGGGDLWRIDIDEFIGILVNSN